MHTTLNLRVGPRVGREGSRDHGLLGLFILAAAS